MTDKVDHPLTERRMREIMRGGQKVSLNTGTLLTLIGTIIAILTVGTALLSAVYLTKGEAYQQKTETLREARQHTREKIAPIEESVTRNSETLHRLDKKMTIIGEHTPGAKAAVRRVDKE